MLFKLISLVHLCAAFPLKCPEPAQWRIRANGHCADPSKYFCLQNDLINGYSENCTRSDFLQAGRKSVLRGGIDAEVCSEERYQPSQYIFYTNASTNCILLKSFCNEEGQVVYDHGNRTTDATCRCDYRRSYAFMIKPYNSCFCKPSQEDCSCFLKICSNDSHILSRDYKCILKSDLPFKSECRAITDENDNNGRRPDVIKTFPKEDNFFVISMDALVPWRKRSVIAVHSCFGISIVVFIFVLFLRSFKRYCLKAIFTSEFQPVYCIEGDKLQLKCSVYSQDCCVNWIKDDIKIEQNENISIESEGKDRFMIVQQAKLSDSGQYVVVAKNVQKQQTVVVEAIFTSELKPVYCIEGEKLQLKCSVYSEDIIVNWIKDGVTMEQDENISIESDGKDRFVIVQHAKLSDSGQYGVVAKNVEKQQTIVVEEMFTSDFKPIHFIEGEKLKLKCSVCSRDFHVEWFKDDNKIDQNENIAIESNGNDYFMTVEHADLSDAGQYIVVAGNVRKQLTVTVKAMFSSEYNSMNCIEGGKLHLKCSVYSEDIDVEWFKNDTKIEPNGNITIKSEGRHHCVIVHRAELGDAGQYIMVARNVRKQLAVTVQEIFTSDFKPKSCIEGEELQLKCSVYSKNIDVEWFRDKTKIEENENTIFESDGMNHCMTVKQAKLSDAGQYVMVAGNVQKQLKVTVKEMFTSEFNPIYCIEGEKLQIECSVFSETIHVEWLFKDFSKIEENEHTIFESNGLHHCMTIKQAKLSDAGQYVMVAGNVQKQLKVTVKDRTELKEALEESLSSQRKAMCNWKYFKEKLQPEAIIDIFIAEGFVGEDLRDRVQHKSRRFQLDSLLSQSIKNIQTSDDYDKFEAIVVQCNSEIELQTPNNDTSAVDISEKTEHRLRSNRELIEKELYPKDHIDVFLEWFIFSLEDHEELRNEENVRNKMAHSFLDKIQQPDYIKKGSTRCLIDSFQQDDNNISKRLSELMDNNASLNGISSFIGDRNLQGLMKSRDACRRSVLCNWTYFKENLNPPNIMDELYSDGLVDGDRADIIREKPRREMVYSTLRNVVRRIDRQDMLTKLLYILKKANLVFLKDQPDKPSQKTFDGQTEYEIEEIKSHLQIWEKDLEREFDLNYIDTFLERNVFDIDDHEIIWEAASGEKGKCFYKKILDIGYIKKGSIDCLVFCLENSKDRKKIRQTLARLLLSKQMPEQVKNRTEIHIKPSREALYPTNTSIFTEGKFKLTCDDRETKENLEEEIFEVAQSSKYDDEEINGLKLKARDTERSSVVVNLKSDDGNVKLIVEKGIVNGDLTNFIRNLLDDEEVKMHMSSEKKYNISVSLHSKDKQKESYSVPFTMTGHKGNPKMRTIKANRDLLEEEYDPTLLLKAVFEDNVKNYKSVENLSPETIAVFKQQLSETNKEPERRDKVKKFLNVAEESIDADTLWELFEDTANHFPMKKMRDDLYGLNSGQDDSVCVEEGLVFEGNYEVWITEEDVKSPLQSMILEERKKIETLSYKEWKQHEGVHQHNDKYLSGMKSTDDEPSSFGIIKNRKTNQRICDANTTTICQEEDNFVRMSLLLTGISTRAVRALFDIKFYPSYLGAFLKKSYNTLKDLKIKRVINQSHWKLLFPRNGYADSNMFDITLMTTLLTHFTELDQYDTLPLVTDTTASADLTRIGYYRNFITHNYEGKIHSSIFNTAWNNINDAVQRLGGKNMLSECEKLRTKTFDKSQVPWNKRVQISQVLESWKMNNVIFVETRAAKHVLKCIQENSCVTITASAGVGKTATLQHVTLKMADEGYDVLPVTSPYDIFEFHNPNKKTLFVIDDFCGTYSLNQFELNSFESAMERLSILIESKLTKILVACRLQVYSDEKFECLSIFRTCICNLLSNDLFLSPTEKQAIAELYLETQTSNVVQYYDLYDCFPLLCKLYNDNHELNIIDFFQNPFSVYETEINTMHKKRQHGKYCVLALCVMFNNRLEEEWMTGDVNIKIMTMIENTCEACSLDRGTSRLFLLNELKTLEHTFIKNEHGIYKTIHDKIFDLLSFYFGQKMIHCLINNAHSELIMQRFLLNRKVDRDNFITIVPTKYQQIYINRMIDDWSEGKLECVFNNINMKIPEFRQRFVFYLYTLDTAFQRQLAHTYDVNCKDTVLILCCQYDDISLIHWCIHHKIEINQSNYKGVCPLYITAQEGHTTVSKCLLDNKADTNKCTNAGKSPLYIACKNNHIMTAKLLLNNNADIYNSTTTRESPLYIACQNNHIEVVKLLLDNNADINQCTDSRESPLYIACQKNHIELVKVLLNNKADIDQCKYAGEFPLYIACQNNHIEVVNLLLDNRANINMCTDDGESPLYIACQQNHIEVVKLLLDNKADINMCTDCGKSPLYIACHNDHIDIAKLLMVQKADINKCTYHGVSPLHIACQQNHIEVVKLLLDNNADINKCTDDGVAPLCFACQQNHIEVAKLLLDNKADINKCTDDGVSPLHIACQQNHIEVVKLFLDNNADINKCTDAGVSPLYIACQQNHIDIAKLFLENNADIDKSTTTRESPLYIACQNNHIEVVKLLLDNNADINKCTDDGVSSLYIACQNNHIEVLKLLLDNNADINKCTDYGVSPLHIACQQNHIDIAKLFLENNADIDKSTTTRISPLYIACQNNHIEVVKLLLDNNADINKCTDDGVSSLYIACQNNHIEVLKLLLDNNADINKCTDDGVSPLYIACQQNHIDIAKLFLENNADIDKSTTTRESPLYIACQNNHIEVVKLLLDNNADINKCTDDGVSPLYIACQQNHIEVVNLLLDNNAGINKCRDGGVSPLCIACQKNHIEVVKLLLDNKADINKCTDDGVSPLHIACQKNYIDMAKLFLDNNADINMCTPAGESPLSIACQKNHIELVKVLLDNNEDINWCMIKEHLLC